MTPTRATNPTLFERCLDLCSSQAEREKVRALAIRLHLSEAAPEWAILLLHAEGRALFGPRPRPPAATPREPIARRILPSLGGALAGGAVALVLTQHASLGAILAELGIAGLLVASARRR